MKKTGFKNIYPQRPLIIRDFRSKLFYSTEGLKPVEKFNLPRGDYFLDQGEIEALEKPVYFKQAILPYPQRSFSLPDDFQLTFSNNPNKCTINWITKSITFDNSLKESTLPELYFILYHEYGHAKYIKEKWADLYARNLMIQKGFNPSQVGGAPITALSSQQYERKKYIVNSIL